MRSTAFLLLWLAGCSDAQFSNGTAERDAGDARKTPGAASTSDDDDDDDDAAEQPKPRLGGDETPGGGAVGNEGWEDDGTAGDEGSCATGDLLLPKYPDDVASCVDAGRLYDFGAASCTDVSLGSSFACTWDEALAAVGKLGLTRSVEGLQKRRSGGAKLVSCAENRGAVILQIWDPVTGDPLGKDCRLGTRVGVMTGCYTITQDDEGGSTAAKVARCLAVEE